jgi:hypothetical protein
MTKGQRELAPGERSVATSRETNKATLILMIGKQNSKGVKENNEQDGYFYGPDHIDHQRRNHGRQKTVSGLSILRRHRGAALGNLGRPFLRHELHLARRFSVVLSDDLNRDINKAGSVSCI